MELADRFIKLSNDSNAASEIMTGGNLTKILDLLPMRLRMTEPGLKVAETDVVKRTAQYMSIKKWVTENQETLILQGAKLEEKTETPVEMITTDSNQSGNAQNSDKTNNRGNRGNNYRRIIDDLEGIRVRVMVKQFKHVVFAI